MIDICPPGMTRRMRRVVALAGTAVAGVVSVLVFATPASAAAHPGGSVAPFDYATACTASVGAAYTTTLYGVNMWHLDHPATFYKGQYCSMPHNRLIMQSDGNLVVYDQNGGARWAAGTNPYGAYAEFQIDGNFVVYDRNNYPVWASNTCCHSFSDSWLAVQQDGNVVIYNGSNRALWATNTVHP